MGGLGAADRTGPAAWQDASEGIAADNLGDLLAAPERREVAQHPSRIGSVVAGGAALHPLGEARRLGTSARSRPAARHHAGHELSRWHQHPGSPQGGGGAKKGVDSHKRDVREALGRCRGGYGTRACVIADGRGRAIAVALAPGQPPGRRMNCRLPRVCSAVCQTCPGGVPGWIVGDRGFASDAFRERIWNLGARPAIPPRRTDAPVACPEWIDHNRHLVENLWARMKEWRAVATRYEKTARSFLGVLCIAATADWLK